MMQKDPKTCRRSTLVSFVFAMLLLLIVSSLVLAQQEKTQAPQPAAAIGVEISTEELKKFLENITEPVVDVRSPKEYSIAHIPGSINIYETEIEQMVQLLKDKNAGMVIYCNGPHCHKVKRVAEQLYKKGYTNVKRYQLGLPVWRASGNTVQTDMEGFRYIYSGDKTAVFVDARSKDEFTKATIPGAVNVQLGEVEVANTDDRLPYTDKGTRIVVFSGSPDEARKVAEEIAQKAFWNSSYFGGTYTELKQAKLW
jgi:rhodanese-related sulfurtransferase